MGRIEVIPANLQVAGTQARSAGAHVTGIAGGASRLAGGDGAPSATAAVLPDFSSAWGRGVADVGSGLDGLGVTVGVAADLYVATDDAVMPER